MQDCGRFGSARRHVQHAFIPDLTDCSTWGRNSAIAAVLDRCRSLFRFGGAPMLADLPHFNNARRYVAPLLIIGAIFAALGLGLTGAISAHANAYWRLDLPIPRSLGFLGASFLVAAAGFLSAGLVVLVRLRLLEQDALQPASVEAPVGVPDGESKSARWRRLLARSRSLLVWRVELLAGWPQAAVALLFGALAVAGVAVTWPVTPFAAADP